MSLIMQHAGHQYREIDHQRSDVPNTVFLPISIKGNVSRTLRRMCLSSSGTYRNRLDGTVFITFYKMVVLVD